MGTKQTGAIGVAAAILHFTNLGYAVFTPVSDVSRYDLVIDDGNGLKRVEVKTTSQENARVLLTTQGGNRTWDGTIKHIDPVECDLVFCYNSLTAGYTILTAEDASKRRTIVVR